MPLEKNKVKEIELDLSEEDDDSSSESSSDSSDSVEIISDDELICISDDENQLKRKNPPNTINVDDELEAKRRKPNVNNAEKNFFQYIPLYQMRIIVSYLDLNSMLKFSQTCSYLRSEYLMRREFWQGLDELNFLPSVSKSLVFDSPTSSTLGIQSNISSLPINALTTLKSFFSIYLENFPFLKNITRLVLDFEKYMYTSLEKNDISYLADSFTQLCDLQFLNVKFKDISKDLRIISNFLSANKIKRLKITFYSSDTNQNLSLISNQAFNELISSLNNLESLHFGFIRKNGNTNFYQFSKNELFSIGDQLGQSLKSFGCESIMIDDLVGSFFQNEREEVLPELEELIIGYVNSMFSINIPSIARNNLKKLVIDTFLTKEANDIQKILNNLPNLQYLNVSLSSVGISSDIKVNGNTILKSNSLKHLKFSNFISFFDSNLVQLDIPNIEWLSLENFGELMIISELNQLQHLKIKTSSMFTGHLHSMLTKCSNSLIYLNLRACSNVRTIHILKDPFSENFSQLRELKISHLKQIEKLSISCVGGHLVEKRIILQKLSFKNLPSLREFSFELGTPEIHARIVHSTFVSCDGLRSITPEPIIHNVESLHYSGNYESPFWNLLSTRFKNMQELINLKFDLKYVMTHIAAVRMSNMLTGFSKLREFSLSCKFSNHSYLFNIALKNLREITICSDQKNAVKFYIVSPLLEVLNMTQTSYMHVRSNTLKHVTASNCEIREFIVQNELNHESAYSSIQSFTCRLSQIEELKSVLHSFTNLKKFVIYGGSVGNGFQETLEQLTKLESLTFEGSIVTLPIVPSLRVLNATSSTVKKIVISNVPNSIVKMNLSSCPQLTQIKFPSKNATLPYLSILDIRGTQINEKYIKTLIHRSPHLKTIRAGNVKMGKDLEKKIRNGNKKASFQ